MGAPRTPADSLADWLTRLETRARGGIVLGLDRVAEVLDRLAPARAPTVLHVAGTNGKGSSVAMLAALLAAAGIRTGVYTSPHLHRYNERIVIDGAAAGDEDIVTAFERVEAARGDVPLTYFEFGTLAALELFGRHGVDAAVLEVGLGGRLDAVNAVDPDGGLITSIALDHQAWLGDTREAIGREKAGIMRSGRPTVFAALDRPVSIDAAALAVGAELLAAGRDFDWVAGPAGRFTYRGPSVVLDNLERPGLPGDFQLANAAGVLCLLETLGLAAGLSSVQVSRTLAGVRVPGRMERHAERFVFDVAHNPAAAAALAGLLDDLPAELPAELPTEVPDDPADVPRRVAVLGVLDDKDVEGIVEPLRRAVDEWIAVTADSPRAIPAAELARRVANAANAPCLIAGSIDAALQEAESRAGRNGEVLVIGSFHTVGPARERLRL